MSSSWIPPQAQESRVTRFGSAAFAGAASSLVASVPASLRVADGELGVASVWLALAGAALVPMIALVLVLRGARRGLASFGGEGAGARALGFVLWVLASLDALLAWAAVLRKTTHHHALAGTTFAFVGLGLLVFVAVLVRRLVALASRWPAAARRLVFLGAIAVLAAVLLFCAARVLAAPPPAGGAAVGMLVDALAFLIAAGFASRATFLRRRLAMIGPPLAVLLFALGLSRLRSPAVESAIAARAPLLSAPVDLGSKLVRW
jgi:hypothetical protein